MSDEQPLVFAPGEVVWYYRAGWRVGHIESLTSKDVAIRPIGTGREKRLVVVPLSSLKKKA